VDLGEAMIVAGVGCRRGASAAAVTAAIEAALAGAGLAPASLKAIATGAVKRDEAGVAAAAAALAVPLVLVAQADLAAAAPRTLTRSERVEALTGLPSLAEAAALAAAGRASRLLAARIAVGPVTCALAATEWAP
jgi:cobalamin biosynthesis protein CbiG